MREKQWTAIEPQLLLADGGVKGSIQVSIALDLHVKQIVILKSSTQPNKIVQVNHIPSQTEVIVGELCSKITDTVDVSAYLVADNATLESAEQKRPTIPEKERIRAIFEEEPTVALRNTLVNKMGNRIDSTTTSDGVTVLGVNQLPDFTEEPLYSNVTVTNTATALRVGASNLSERCIIMIQPKGKTIFIGWNNGVTAGNSGNGMKVTSNSFLILSVIGSVDIFAITSSGNAKVHVTEGK